MYYAFNCTHYTGNREWDRGPMGRIPVPGLGLSSVPITVLYDVYERLEPKAYT